MVRSIQLRVIYVQERFKYYSKQTRANANPVQETRVVFIFCWFYTLGIMLETCVSMTFPDFQRQVEWCRSYFTKISLKAYI